MRASKLRLNICFTVVITMMMAAVAMLAGCSNTSVSESLSPEGFQEKLLEGGVTDAEYRVAIEALKICMEAKGWETDGPTLREDGITLGVDVIGKGDPNDIDALAARTAKVNKDQSDCFVAYVQLVERKYVADNQPTEAERADQKVAFIACLERAGLVGMLITDDFQTLAKKAEQQLGTDDNQSMLPFSYCVGAHPQAFPPQGP